MSRWRASPGVEKNRPSGAVDAVGLLVCLAALLLGGVVLWFPDTGRREAGLRLELQPGGSDAELLERVRRRIAATPPARRREAWEPERLSARWRYITIHHSATVGGNAARFDRYHRRERGLAHGLPYHFVIGNGNGSADGYVEVGPRWREQLDGGHVRGRDLNREAIGICLVGNFEQHLPSERQIASLKSLVTCLMEMTGIGEERVLGHKGMPGQMTLCPGRFLPVEEVLRYREFPPRLSDQ